MPVELRRFGVGHRRPDGPPGTRGIEAQVIEGGQLGVIAELAFDRHARITPHSNPNWTCFLVIEGGGWVGVGEERTRVQAGEAAVWPPDVIHAAWTDGTPMRAIVVELFARRVAPAAGARGDRGRAGMPIRSSGARAAGAAARSTRSWTTRRPRKASPADGARSGGAVTGCDRAPVEPTQHGATPAISPGPSHAPRPPEDARGHAPDGQALDRVGGVAHADAADVALDDLERRPGQER